MSVFNQSRSNIIRLIFGGMFLVIFAQLFNLQVVSDKYKKMAAENALFPKRIYPSRGICSAATIRTSCSPLFIATR